LISRYSSPASSSRTIWSSNLNFSTMSRAFRSKPAMYALRVLRQHLLLRRLEHAIEPAQHDQRQDHLAVLGLLVVAPQQVGHRPDECSVVEYPATVGDDHSVLPCSPSVIPGVIVTGGSDLRGGAHAALIRYS
jgi:hypothetical protein